MKKVLLSFVIAFLLVFSVTGSSATAKAKQLDTPKITKFTSTDQGVKIIWNPVKGAKRYSVFYLNRNRRWIKMGTVSGTSFIDKDVNSNKTYTYTVRCQSVNKKTYTSDFNHKGWKYTYNLPTPKITKLISTDQGIKITWSKVSGASRYRVYRKGTNGWKTLGDSKSTAFFDKKVGFGKTYIYTIRCVKSNGKNPISDYSHKGWKSIYTLSMPQINKYESTAAGIKITWSKVSRASRYRLYRKVNSKWIKVADTTNNTFVDRNVTSSKSYTYTVKCINKAGNSISSFDKTGFTAVYQINPTVLPTEPSTVLPTEIPTAKPTEAPVKVPSELPTESPTEPPTEAPTDPPLDTPSNIRAEMIDSGSITYDTVGKWSISKYYVNSKTGSSGESDKFEYIANETNYVVIPGEKPLEKERYIDSYIEYSDDGSKATIHWNKTEDKEGYTFSSYYISAYHKTKDEQKCIVEMNYDNLDIVTWKRKNYNWKIWDDNKQGWVNDTLSKNDTSCTFNLPVLAKTPAKVQLSWDPVSRAEKYIIENLQNSKWNTVTESTVPYCEISLDFNSKHQYRIKAVSASGTTSAYALKTFTTQSRFVEDEKAYSYEEQVYERQERQICNLCGADITPDYNYASVFHHSNGKISLDYECIGDRYPDAYNKYLYWYENCGMTWLTKLTEEQFRYGHPNAYQHINEKGEYYVTFDDGDYETFHFVDYHEIDGSGCIGGRWHSDYRSIPVATRTVEVPASGHYEIVLK